MMRSDEMLNILFAILFIVLSLVTFLSVLFRVEGNFIDEDVIFSSQGKAILFYFINIIVAAFMTMIFYILICVLQRAV